MTIVDAGDERVHVVETGRPGATPPLLLTSGLGSAWFDWQPSVELLNAGHRVIAFDRPGLGLSPAGKAPPSLRREIRLLADLARWAGPPVVLLAHSMAGFHVEALARVHPELVAGMVLVDPSYERRLACPSFRIAAATTGATRAAGHLLNVTRAARLLGPLGRRIVMRFTSRRDEPVDGEVVRSVYGRGTVLGTVLAEELAYREMAADLEALRGRLPFPPVPLVVLTALGDASDPEDAQRWIEDHARLAAMSPRGEQVILPDTLHMVQLDRPDAVADAVARVLQEAA
ncbi:alpha/beta fold hydrolase [Actinomadura kijaniata]|uniref:alpha/beta fold hydrolase n=1 Tax=Actinomadura kijaniata TaxID=46161 RepID=UPI003F1D494E